MFEVGLKVVQVDFTDVLDGIYVRAILHYENVFK